jgi:hypothetical protein
MTASVDHFSVSVTFVGSLHSVSELQKRMVVNKNSAHT